MGTVTGISVHHPVKAEYYHNVRRLRASCQSQYFTI